VLFDVEAISTAKDKPANMSADIWAKAIERVLDEGQKSVPEFKYKDLMARLQTETKRGERTIHNYASLLSTDPEKPTMITIDDQVIAYYASKGESKTAPWMITRKVQ